MTASWTVTSTEPSCSFAQSKIDCRLSSTPPAPIRSSIADSSSSGVVGAPLSGDWSSVVFRDEGLAGADSPHPVK